VPTQDQIEREIVAGLPYHKQRLEQSWKQLQFSKANFVDFPTKSKDGRRWNGGSTRRTSPLFKRVVSVLTSNLYKSQPTRKLADPVQTAWLQDQYKHNKMHAKWKRADELTLIGGLAGYQFSGTTNLNNPIKITLWGADEIVWWVDPDDPLIPVSVATRDRYEGAMRMRLYAKDEIVTYISEKSGQSTLPGWAGTAAFREVKGKGGRIANPYRDADGEGVIPFSFCHWETPTQVFTCDGPGYGLTECNEYVNEDLDKLGDAKNFIGRPIGLASGVAADWAPPTELKPGDFLKLPAADIDAGGTGILPTLSYLVPELSFVEVDWNDLNFYIDHTLEMNGVPPVLIRMIQTSARSGESIKAEQTPLITWVEGRRGQWADFEEDAAKKCIEVTAAHLRINELEEDANKLQAILDDWQFTLRWPNLYQITPGPERDIADDYRVERGYASKVMIVMERDGLTEIEAIEHLAKVQEQNDTLAALGVEPEIPAQLAATQAAQLAQDQFDADSGANEDSE
jgi:hypothetical protein